MHPTLSGEIHHPANRWFGDETLISIYIYKLRFSIFAFIFYRHPNQTTYGTEPTRIFIFSD